MKNGNNIHPHEFLVSTTDREKLMGHSSCVIWFTGLSGSGKSTIASQVEHELFLKGVKTFSLDGDNVRLGLNSDLGFSNEDRTENIRRVGEVSKLFVDAGLVVLSCFVSPFEKDRKQLRDKISKNKYIEIYVKCSLETAEKRDPKGLYKKARENQLNQMTGIDSSYEVPVNPELVIDTEENSVKDSVDKILNYLKINHRIG